MGNKTTLDERSLDRVNARVPFELQDELKEPYARGHTPTEIVKEGIRQCSKNEGIMNRLKTVARVETIVSAQE